VKFYTLVTPCLVLTFIFGYLFLLENGRKWETAFGICNILMVGLCFPKENTIEIMGWLSVSRVSLYLYHI
jgi:hypothetical protein